MNVLIFSVILIKIFSVDAFAAAKLDCTYFNRLMNGPGGSFGKMLDKVDFSTTLEDEITDGINLGPQGKLDFSPEKNKNLKASISVQEGVIELISIARSDLKIGTFTTPYKAIANLGINFPGQEQVEISCTIRKN